MNNPTAAYVHVPFCIHRCGYCDFTVITNRDDLIGTYLECLEREMKPQVTLELDTLFIGGGTPSYLAAKDLEQLFAILKQRVRWREGAEYSIECNPENFTTDRMRVIAEAGINRVSLGVQSFDQQHLNTLERRHSADEVADVVRRLREHDLNNISLDLIFAVPGQTLQDWESTLDHAMALKPQHISTYGLTFEKGTTFWARKNKQLISVADEELERAMYQLAMERLPAQGYQQYELSNFAKPGFESRHNQVYWQGNPYYGFGPGAASYINGIRGCNHRSVSTWIKRVQAGQSPISEQEELTTELRAREAVMLGLRQIAGIHLETYEREHGCTLKSLNPNAFEQFVEAELLEVADGHLRLTQSGRFIADTIMTEFL